MKHKVHIISPKHETTAKFIKSISPLSTALKGKLRPLH